MIRFLDTTPKFGDIFYKLLGIWNLKPYQGQFYSLLYYNPLVYLVLQIGLLLMCDFVTSYLCHLGTISYGSYVDLLKVNTLHGTK